MKGQKQLFSSNNQEVGTPQWLFDMRHKEQNFTIDLAASAKNAKLPTYFTEEQDALKQSWGGHRGWLNPPYELAPEFIEKTWYETRGGWMKFGRDYPSANLVELLLPVRCSNPEWHKFIFPWADELIFIDGRLIFEGEAIGAPFPSVLVIFKDLGRMPNEPIKVSTLDARSIQAKIKAHERATANLQNPGVI